MKFKPSHISVRHPKRLVIIIVSAVLVATLATYGVFSYLHWREYDQSSQKAATSLKTAVDESLGSAKTSPAPSAQIDTVVTDFNKTYGENPCQVSVWYSWQTVIPQLKTMTTSCKDRFKIALEVIKTLKPLSQFLKDEKKISDLLATGLEATKAPTDYAAASTIWKDVSESAELPTNDNFKLVKTKSTELAVAISTAYTTLQTAISIENKADFDAATSGLQAAYAGIDSLEVTVNDERTKLIQAFITTYKKL